MCRGAGGEPFDLNGESVPENSEKLMLGRWKRGKHRKALRPGPPGRVESLFHSEVGEVTGRKKKIEKISANILLFFKKE